MEGMPLFRRALEQFTVEQLIFLMNDLIDKHFFFHIKNCVQKRTIYNVVLFY